MILRVFKMKKPTRRQYDIKEDGHFNGPVLKHMREVTYTPVTKKTSKFNEYSNDDVLIKAAEEKRAKKALKRMSKKDNYNEEY